MPLATLVDLAWADAYAFGIPTWLRALANSLVDTARTTRLGSVVSLARAKLDSDRQTGRGVERYRGA